MNWDPMIRYAAKCYDSGGAEDPEASGCTTTFHVSFDDDWMNLFDCIV